MNILKVLFTLVYATLSVGFLTLILRNYISIDHLNIFDDFVRGKEVYLFFVIGSILVMVLSCQFLDIRSKIKNLNQKIADSNSDDDTDKSISKNNNQEGPKEIFSLECATETAGGITFIKAVHLSESNFDFSKSLITLDVIKRTFGIFSTEYILAAHMLLSGLENSPDDISKNVDEVNASIADCYYKMNPDN